MKWQNVLKAINFLCLVYMSDKKVQLCCSMRFQFLILAGNNHIHLRNTDCLSFVMCQLLAPVLIVNRLLFFFFFFRCFHLQNYWSKQGRWYTPLISLYYLDVYGNNSQHTVKSILIRLQILILDSLFYVFLCNLDISYYVFT
jgi:hypothetical protein